MFRFVPEQHGQSNWSTGASELQPMSNRNQFDSEESIADIAYMNPMGYYQQQRIPQDDSMVLDYEDPSYTVQVANTSASQYWNQLPSSLPMSSTCVSAADVPLTRMSRTPVELPTRITEDNSYKARVGTVALQRSALHRRKHQAKFRCHRCDTTFTTARNQQRKLSV
ncbi:hypothetical protein H0H92_004733 [Tricholoma furcatifolium]|nr:hypothetical protein H0H92_004733 [Tricholoma furcatifolium]